MIVLLFYLFKYNQIKSQIPIYQLRIVRYQVGYLFNSGSELLFYNYFISSFVELMGLLAIVKGVMTYKIDKYIVISIISLLVFSLIGLGRFGLFNAVFFVFSTFFFLPLIIKKSSKNKKSRKKIIFSLVLVLILLLFMVLIGFSRTSSELNNVDDLFSIINESFTQAMLYFTAPFRALDYFINNRSIFVNNFFGRAFFSGIDEFFNFILSFLGFSSGSSNTIISELTKEPILVGNGIYFNAFYTGVFNGYLDGGVLGVVICGILLGVIAGIIWNFHMKNRNYFSFSLIVYFALMLISTEYRFEFQQFKSFVIIGVLIILAKKIKNKR
ncbi:O-antigen polymerase [Candidatus Enterococcus mansonii]|uniref:Oligosaccharide repeat unit polymerase n=1 Tax=Candidatus Enterococcus mansonii TaxID=1834181 RepID=A0ABU8ICY4_9ENTE